MDIVYLHGLRLETVIGVWDWERHIRQTLIVDLDMGADVARAAASDSIDDTIDYKTVADRLIEIGKESSFALVESLAERIAGELTGALGIPWVRVRITKSGALRGAREVGVLIERGTLAVRGGGAEYFNLVAGFDSDQSPAEIVATLKAIEHRAGRRRGGSACALDLDLLVVGDLVLTGDACELPRRDILEHAFVLRPLAELAPAMQHPIAGQSYAALWQALAPRAPRLVRVPWPPGSG